MNELKTIKNALELLRVSPNAISFFLTSYRIGRASVGQVAKASKMDRSSAYLAFESLKDLGLMEEDLGSGPKLVWPREPKAMTARLRTEIRRLRQQVENLEEEMPNLLAEYGSRHDSPVLQFFSGQDGLRNIVEDVLEKTSDELLLYSNFNEEKKVFTARDHEDFIRRRVEKNIKLRLLAADTTEAREIQTTDRASLRQTKIIVGKIPFLNETYIYGDNIAMLSFNEKTGVVGFIVRSKDFADHQRWLFEEIWKKL
ncbi:MAG: Transcriptional regulator, TrmB [Candidatus Uhrbacteria bacterium GW2011_GWE2_45_35]|uniref:Transcriptional regulator, TrmB n=2 Tax=Candidatus Uhriibacteriota TaxID=1752732 RepID=A0A0G1JG12_9BACT|nr:MAG: Transcriptional regulator, TrmB [Candidatus Uhrbacteria bacterium GW2011_GWF2_44_350]KKU07146.1 MAG: Transcriptional regulator, TrmB [Candidatus Uhrbacteria bacterium GW2011_GWE2_45_35]HBR80571.1 hypothetical protein [Candidatus Uhrbacteria bacterium]HCU31494.1 hypothetical protein [Candidatus Uhrbacteria bacterium]